MSTFLIHSFILLCLSCVTIVVTTGVRIRSRLLSHLPSNLLRHELLNFLDFNSLQQMGRTHHGWHSMVDSHLSAITARNYRDVINILNLTVDEFTSNFPPFKIQLGIVQTPEIPTGMARHQVRMVNDGIFKLTRQCLLIFELREVAISQRASSESAVGEKSLSMDEGIKRSSTFFVCRSEDGDVVSGYLIKYFHRGEGVYATTPTDMQQERLEAVESLKSVFYGKVFRIGNSTLLTRI